MHRRLIPQTAIKLNVPHAPHLQHNRWRGEEGLSSRLKNLCLPFFWSFFFFFKYSNYSFLPETGYGSQWPFGLFGQIFLCFFNYAYASRAILLWAQLMSFKDMIGLHKKTYRSRCNMGRPLKIALYSQEKAFFP